MVMEADPGDLSQRQLLTLGVPMRASERPLWAYAGRATGACPQTAGGTFLRHPGHDIEHSQEREVGRLIDASPDVAQASASLGICHGTPDGFPEVPVIDGRGFACPFPVKPELGRLSAHRCRDRVWLARVGLLDRGWALPAGPGRGKAVVSEPPGELASARGTGAASRGAAVAAARPW
jgi:hypothetical protein